MSGLRRRARHQRHAEDRAEAGIHLRAVRRLLRADAGRDGRRDVHRQPRLRRITAHNPDDLSLLEYYRQLYWGSGVDLPEEGYDALVDEFIIDHVELGPGEKGVLSVQLPAEFVIVFEPVTHSAQFIDAKGEPTRERQALSLLLRP
ncbi:MAG: DUF5939 domain-containing protein [Asticcacaulis sp.]|nr:DUF5939 domain-containing protein [Asticcacaulis sp.]